MSRELTVVSPEAPAPTYDVSVITVCFRALEALKRTVNAVAELKAENAGLRIEHIIVDGASADGTAEWLEEEHAAGRIETYLSEQDAGIYDAMNKGINLAYGRVLWFLNADDTPVKGLDLQALLRPILEGETSVVAAGVDCGKGKLHLPRREMLFMGTFCNHQGYFATAELYHKLGGYDAREFRCCADADFMNKAALATKGEMHMTDDLAAIMPPGGFSAGCALRFLHEITELMYRYRAPMLHRAAEEADYRELLVSRIFWAVVRLRSWQEEYGKDIPAQLQHLATLCADFASQAPTQALRRAMHFIAQTYLPHLCTHRCDTRLLWLRLRRHLGVITCTATNPYREKIEIPEISLGKTMAHYIRRLLHLSTH